MTNKIKMVVISLTFLIIGGVFVACGKKVKEDTTQSTTAVTTTEATTEESKNSFTINSCYIELPEDLEFEKKDDALYCKTDDGCIMVVGAKNDNDSKEVVNSMTEEAAELYLLTMSEGTFGKINVIDNGFDFHDEGDYNTANLIGYTADGDWIITSFVGFKKSGVFAYTLGNVQKGGSNVSYADQFKDITINLIKNNVDSQ